MTTTSNSIDPAELLEHDAGCPANRAEALPSAAYAPDTPRARCLDCRAEYPPMPSNWQTGPMTAVTGPDGGVTMVRA